MMEHGGHPEEHQPTPLEESLCAAARERFVGLLRYELGTTGGNADKAVADLDELLDLAKAEAVEPFLKAANLGSTILMQEAIAEAQRALNTNSEVTS